MPSRLVYGEDAIRWILSCERVEVTLTGENDVTLMNRYSTCVGVMAFGFAIFNVKYGKGNFNEFMEMFRKKRSFIYLMVLISVMDSLSCQW